MRSSDAGAQGLDEFWEVAETLTSSFRAKPQEVVEEVLRRIVRRTQQVQIARGRAKRMLTVVFGFSWQNILIGVALVRGYFHDKSGNRLGSDGQNSGRLFSGRTFAGKLWADKPPIVRFLGIAGKNLLGVALVVVGILLSLPGVPGQGILTILLGIMLLDFPGKKKLEHKLVSRPQVRNAINKLRAKFGKPELVLD